jgi:pimeloyl-CoA synthetase
VQYVLGVVAAETIGYMKPMAMQEVALRSGLILLLMAVMGVILELAAQVRP